jgi:hypothetical protein
MQELPEWLRELGYKEFESTNEETIFLLKLVKNRLDELGNDQYADVAAESIKELESRRRKQD